MTYAARFVGISLLLMALWLQQSFVYAQDSPTPFIDIVNVDTSQAPTLQLSVVGGNLPDDWGTLPLKLFEGNQEQAIASSQTVSTGIELALVIDPHDILAPGASGQSHYNDV